MPNKHRGPLMGELLGGGALIAIATGAITFATQWGGVLAQVEDHLDPGKHAAIVLAGNIETDRKITQIETTVDAIKEDLEEGHDQREAQAEKVTEIQMNQAVILEQIQRVLEEAKRGRRAAERHNDDGGPD